jgi:hydrogenase maturation protein HypF
VEGVGFRPFVHGLATRLGLAGLVGNDTHGVFVEVEGPGHRHLRGPPTGSAL